MSTESAKSQEWPKYLLIIDGADQWVPRSQVGGAYDNGFAKVEFGQWVIEVEGDLPRRMTEEDRQMIRRAADAYSDSK